jgi:hypothetical protein
MLGGGDDESQPSLSPDPIDEEARAILERMTLTTADLGDDLPMIGTSVSTNTDVAGGLAGAREQLEKLREWGRRLGADVEFQRGPETPEENPVQGLQNSMSLYLTPEGASASFADGVDGARELDWGEVYQGLYLFRFEELEHAPVDDESVWFRASGYQQDGRLVIDDQAVFRTGPVRGFLRVLTVHPEDAPRDIFQDEVEMWVRLLSERVKAVIASQAEAATVSE